MCYFTNIVFFLKKNMLTSKNSDKKPPRTLSILEKKAGNADDVSSTSLYFAHHYNG
jgi:hypothetical protein